MEKQPNIINRILQNRILSHALFWLSSMVFFAVYAKGFGMLILAAFIIKGFFLPVQILATYYLVYYQIPTFIYKRRYLRFFISLLLSAMVFCTVAHLVEDLGMSHIVKGYTEEIHTFWEIISNPFANIGYNAEDIYLTVFIATGIKFIKQRLEGQTQLTVLEQEKIKVEIDYLKAQVNPRILSKTLHQLHTLTKEKSDAAPEVVIKLSDMLDYMLYRCNEPKVLINKEIELLQNYLDLEELQYGENLKISFFHSLENKFAEITPLLLLSAVEVIFLKESGTFPANAKVELLLKEVNDQLSLKVLSTLRKEKKQLAATVKRQLDLLYPNQYTLQETVENGVYKLDLSIDLNFSAPKIII